MSNKRKNGYTSNGFAPHSKKSRLSNDSEDSALEESQEIAEVGIIESLSLKNFMCHTSLKFTFGSNVNIVIGRNGSGKSAILTAIIVGLGGKANVTNRGSTVKVFIKNGKNSAEIKIRLRNCGTDAYKPELYGNSILVERHLFQDGTSSYKLRGSNDQVVSTKRDELVHILDQFNIQVDNPVSLLNQEVSRHFIHSKSPHDKYKFFLKGTHLEQMDRDYNAADEQKRIAALVLEKKKEVMPDLEKEVEDWHKKYRYHESMDKLRERLENLKNEAAWAQVAELEKELAGRLKKLKQEEIRTPKFEEKLEQSKNKLNKAKESYKDVEERLKTITDALDSLNPQRATSKQRFNSEREALRSYVMSNRKLVSDVKSIESDRKDMLKRIDELRATTFQKDIQLEKQKRLRNINSKEEEKKNLEDQRRTTQHHLEQLQNSTSKYKDDMYNMGEEDKRIKGTIKQLTQQLRNIEASRNNKLQRFGNWVPELTKKINDAFNKGLFRHKPIGPLGSCISLKDGKWALAIEICVSGLLMAFWVDNHKDERVLEGLMRETLRNVRRPSIIVTQFVRDKYNVSRNAVDSSHYPSVLEMLEFDEPMVANCFIDRCTVESTLLIENNSTAREVMSKRPPAKCRDAFTLDGDHLFPTPGYRYYSNSKQRQPRFLQKSIDDCINTIREEIDSLTNEQKRIEVQINSRKSQYQENLNEQKRTEADVSRLRQHINRLHLEITELKNIDEPEAIDVTVLEDEVKIMDQQLKELRGKQTEVHGQMTEKQETVRQIEEELKEFEGKINKIMTEKIDPLKDALERATSDVSTMENEKKHYTTSLKEHQKTIANLLAKHDEMKQVVEDTCSKAERICERVETRRPASAVDDQIAQVTKHLQKGERDRGTREEVTRRYYEAKKRFDQLSKDIEEVNNFNKQLQEVMKKRRGNYLSYRRMLSIRVSCLFTAMLNLRDFNGKMTFDHERELLSLQVQPRQSVTDENQDVRGLSGGERSFSTVSFILALWDAMESPFRILDEFDVFMDMVTRRICMDMMLETATSKKSCQYCFLSPLEMTAANYSEKVKVFRMADPDRNQHQPTLNFTWNGDDNEQINE